MFQEKTEQQQNQQRATNTYTVADQVVIAVKAEKVMSKSALAWALTHVVHPGDCITLLAVFTNEKSGNTDSQLLKNLLLLSTFLFWIVDYLSCLMCVGKKFWNFPRLAGDCGSNQLERLPDRVCEISENCSQMVVQFYNQIEVSLNLPICPLACFPSSFFLSVWYSFLLNL